MAVVFCETGRQGQLSYCDDASEPSYVQELETSRCQARRHCVNNARSVPRAK
jgi:hypothetical protein